MRRKSTRNASKATTEKTAPVAEVPVRKSRRHSKRRKRSSSTSSSNDSDDVSLKTIAQQAVEVSQDVKDNSPKNEEETAEQPVWKVTPSAAPSGEIQKLKICLTRPSPSSPEKTERSSKRRRNKSGSQNDEDVVGNVEERVTRKSSRHRGSPGASVEEQEEEFEEQEEKKGSKGKSKTKHKSKGEKGPQIQEAEDQTQSEISENVQVTPQSPQAAIDIRVDNENVLPSNEHETFDSGIKEICSVPQTINTTTAIEIVDVKQGSPQTISQEKEVNVTESDSDKGCVNTSDSQTDIKSCETPQESDVTVQTVEEVKDGSQKAKIEIQAEVQDPSLQTQNDQAEKSADTCIETDEKPSETVEDPLETAKKPTATVESMETAEKPSVTVEDPLETAEKPTATVESMEITEKPSETVEDPMETAEKPSATVESMEITEKPSKTVEDPMETAEKPTATVESMETTEKPSETVEDPLETAEKPSVIVEEQSATIENEIQVVNQTEDATTMEVEESKNETPEGEPEKVAKTVQDVNQEETVAPVELPEQKEQQAHESRSQSPSSEGAVPPNQNQEDQERPEASPVLRKDTSVDESSTKSITLEEDDSRSIDATNLTMDTSLTLSQKEETSFNLTRSFSPDVHEMLEVNKEVQHLREQVADLFQTPEPKERKRSWGNSLVSLELLQPNLVHITMETIKEFCPDLHFLDQDEVRIDVHEPKDRRKSSSEYKERRLDRKVSVEYKSDDKKRLETQHSSEMEEMETNETETDNSNIIAMNRKISIVDDTASKLKPPPSPAKNPVSEVLHITNLVRPFTLKALKELLERTGKIRENGFWTNRIKSQCYVYYETNEEAEATRNALHGVHWPIGNGKMLIIDFATPEALEEARKPPPVAPPEPKGPDNENQEIPAPAAKRTEEPEKVSKEKEKHKVEGHVREWDIGKEDLHRGRSHSRERMGRNERSERRRHKRTPSPVDDFLSRKRKKEEDVPQKLMDDLFRKTKATPSIYWLPLTPEEIATKQQQRLLRMAEHKRRMEETTRGGTRGDYGRGAPYRRRYD